MNVKQLIAALKKLDPDTQVIVQKDSEGNGYSPLRGVDGNCVYLPDNNWSGQILSTEMSADDLLLSEDKWKKLKSDKKNKAVVLFPAN